MKNSIWNIISIIVILFLSIVAWYLYDANRISSNKILLMMEHKKILETSVAKITEEKKSIEEKLTALSAENGEALAKIDEYGARVEAMASEYKTKIDDLTAQRDSLKRDIDVIGRELAGKNSEISFLKRSFKNLDKKLKGVKSGNGQGPVSLDPIVVTRPKNVSGKVIEVDKNYGFVIVDIGSNDGISAGDTLFVSRKKELLGKVVVEEAAEKYSAAKILYKSLGDTVKKADTVTN